MYEGLHSSFEFKPKIDNPFEFTFRFGNFAQRAKQGTKREETFSMLVP